MTDLETRTVDVAGATLRYDIRGDLTASSTANPVLMLVGSPMDASGFATLATYFTDRPVVTYDPRGSAPVGEPSTPWPWWPSVPTCASYEHDLDALNAARTRIVVAVGEESEGEMAARGGATIAERLGTEPTVFPSHHIGFLGGEFGMHGEPDSFAAALRLALGESP